MYLILKSESRDQRELPFKHKVLDNTSKDFCTDALSSDLDSTLCALLSRVIIRIM